jgi:hypothetical protein
MSPVISREDEGEVIQQSPYRWSAPISIEEYIAAAQASEQKKDAPSKNRQGIPIIPVMCRPQKGGKFSSGSGIAMDEGLAEGIEDNLLLSPQIGRQSSMRREREWGCFIGAEEKETMQLRSEADRSKQGYEWDKKKYCVDISLKFFYFLIIYLFF